MSQDPPVRPPKSCVVCGIAMVAGKSRDSLMPHFDIFTCLNCGTVVAVTPPPKPEKPPRS